MRKINSGSEGFTSRSGFSATQASSIFFDCVGSIESELFELFELIELFSFAYSSSRSVMRWISFGKSTWGEGVGFVDEGSCSEGTAGGLVVCFVAIGGPGEQLTAVLRMAVLRISCRHRCGVGEEEGMGMRVVDERVVRLQDRESQLAR